MAMNRPPIENDPSIEYGLKGRVSHAFDIGDRSAICGIIRRIEVKFGSPVSILCGECRRRMHNRKTEAAARLVGPDKKT